MVFLSHSYAKKLQTKNCFPLCQSDMGSKERTFAPDCSEKQNKKSLMFIPKPKPGTHRLLPQPGTHRFGKVRK